uniref:Uncharacterized protein n=1 Tax=Acrobeloides nanus TaxID=290746 RepID=A0A914D180_9BILA
MECAALSYIIFSFAKIHEYFVTNFDVEEGGIKFCKIFQFLQEITTFYNKLHEDLTMAAVFLADFFDTWIDMKAFDEDK